MRNNLVYIPEGPCRVRILTEWHDGSLGAHFVVAKTFELISRTYWWPQMWKLVKDFIKTCDIYARSKTAHHCPYGLLRPLPRSDRPWSSISMEFIWGAWLHLGSSGLIYQNGAYYTMLQSHLRLRDIESNLSECCAPPWVAWWHHLRSWCHISHFWKCLFHILGTTTKLLTVTFHPQTDAQTERINQVL